MFDFLGAAAANIDIDFSELFTWTFIVVAILCGTVGEAIKKAGLNSCIIPAINLFVGGLAYTLMMLGLGEPFTFAWVIYGIIAAGISSYIYDLFKGLFGVVFGDQTIKKEVEIVELHDDGTAEVYDAIKTEDIEECEECDEEEEEATITEGDETITIKKSSKKTTAVK